MTPATEARLQELLDRAAIQDVLLRYARGVDRRDLDLVASCFTPDASYEGTLGRGGVAQALAALREAMTRYESTMHFLGNQVIEIAGDRAESETYAIAYHRLHDQRNLVVAVRYLDQLTRTAGRWLIARRVATVAWRRLEDPAPPEVP
jgi:ketosteroid isomerase-like protein